VLAGIGQRQVGELAHRVGEILDSLGIRRRASQQRVLHALDVRVDAQGLAIRRLDTDELLRVDESQPVDIEQLAPPAMHGACRT